MYLTSQLSTAYSSALESLLFFNSQQSRVSDQIVQAVEEFGSPKIVVEESWLRIHLSKFDKAQSIYVLCPSEAEPVLIGFFVYYRPSITEVSIIHLALNPEYMVAHGLSPEDTLLEIISQFRVQLKRIKGVDMLSFCYTPVCLRILRTHRDKSCRFSLLG